VRLAAFLAFALLSLEPCVAAEAPALPQQSPEPVPTSNPAWLVSVDAAQEVAELSNKYPDWTSTYLFAKERGLFGRPTYYQYWNDDERYGFHDLQFGAGGAFFVTPKTLAGIELAESPTHNVLPSFVGALDVEQRFGDGYGAIATYTRRTYTTTNASIENLLVDRYLGKYRFTYSMYLAQLSGTPGTAVTQTLSATAFDDRGGDLTLSGYGGRDVESTGPTSVLVMDVAGVALYGHAMVAKHLAVSYGVEAWNQGNLFTAAGLRLGLRYAF
jgi:YaiO family outer membrane protein